MPQHFRQAGYLAVSYGKIFHQYLDDQHSWSSQAEFPDNHTYRGLSGEAWIRHGGAVATRHASSAHTTVRRG